ncbi:ATP-binding cassette domain-containing protein [Streptomyces cinnamoneus]|uniref:ATP-binding cassette domain-containing protein n=1 Tax=Streptomyces sp. NPDC053079 TaxID=3365697 RepID=UPI000903E803
MIEIQELTKRYGSTVAVDDLSFSVKSGTVTGFLGPNGAGKSTTMRITMGLDHPLRGRVLLDGRHYGQLREPIRHVGALLEAKAAQRSRTAYHHLLWLAQTNRIGRRRVREVLELVGLEPAAARRAGGFSLGMGQRLGLAAALLGDPGILILDEPANGLDPEGVRWIRTLLKKLAAEGRTVFVSSHLMSEMAITADHLIVIGRGRLLADTSMAGFIADNCRPSVRIRTPQPGLLRAALEEAGLHAVREVDGTMTVEEADTAAIGRIAADRGITLDELSAQQSSLEEAFLRLTSHAAEYRAAATVAGEWAS